jgi:hypothetical protein
MDALNENGIALIHRTHDNENGVAVETLFLHESGESISGGLFHVPVIKKDAQGYMSALTYARRGSLMAACGIAPEDDDGEEASKIVPIKPSVRSIDELKQLIKEAGENWKQAYANLNHEEQQLVRQAIKETKGETQ